MHIRLILITFVTALVIGCDSLPLRTEPKVTIQSTAEAATQSTKVNPVSSERTYDSVWEHIRAGYGLPQESNSAIDAQIRFYTTNKSYFYKVTQQSEPYLHYVVNQMQANGMPLEFALLPFIESSYNPTAMSPANVGMWQFGAATGRNFGLVQNSWYDGRKDVVASTDAAIRLLKKLYAKFGNDWLLAIAAYNAGEGSVQQAIDKNRRAGKPTDFWSLPLTKTTQGYIPQLLALSKIVGNPNIYDFKLYPIPDVPFFVKINVNSQINLAEAAEKTSVDVSLLKKLNAGFRGSLTDPTEPRQLLIPVDAAARFKLQLDSLPTATNTKWQEHLVKKGDSLTLIAQKYGANAARIKAVNNIKSENLVVGQRLQIPLSPSDGLASAPLSSKATVAVTPGYKTSADKGKANSYVVKPGENLWSIAKAQAISVNELARLNNITTQSILKPGQKLTLSNELNRSAPEIESRTLSHTIKSGDTLGKIAARYDVSVKEIMQWNQIKDESNIRPNQQLIVLVDENKTHR